MCGGTRVCFIRQQEYNAIFYIREWTCGSDTVMIKQTIMTSDFVLFGAIFYFVHGIIKCALNFDTLFPYT